MLMSSQVAKQIVEEFIPFHKFLGVELIEVRDGYCKLRFPFRAEVIGDPRSQRWHGGVIASGLDGAGGLVAMTTLQSAEDKVATIDIRVDYLRGTGPSDIIFIGELVRSGNRVISTKMQAWQEDEKKLVAESRAMFSVYRMDK